MNNSIWLIGSGPMAIDYCKVLLEMGIKPIVIGRGESSAQKLKEATGIDVIVGGLVNFLSSMPQLPSCAIVAVGVDQLAKVTEQLISYGINRILLEKPGGINSSEILNIANISRIYGVRTVIAYNRRYYASVQKAKQIIEQDGGVTSFFFEFTEWSHIIEKLSKPMSIMNSWFLANSSHVIDLAFFLGGYPKEIYCKVLGSLTWHPAASCFFGSGISETGAGFSYIANWSAPGRWGLEIMTKSSRLILRPLEQLQIMRLGSIVPEQVLIDDTLDKKFKPGLYREVEAFLKDRLQDACLIDYQAMILPVYMKMAGYQE